MLGKRANGVFGSDLDWHLLQPLGRSSSSTEMVLAKPEPGERPTQLRGTVMESADREQRLLDAWCVRLREELVGCIATLESSLDPNNGAIGMLAARTRVTTLKRYVTVFQKWRLWLLEAKQISPPRRPADLVDYLLTRWDEPCGKKAICWMEKVATASMSYHGPRCGVAMLWSPANEASTHVSSALVS